MVCVTVTYNHLSTLIPPLLIHKLWVCSSLYSVWSEILSTATYFKCAPVLFAVISHSESVLRQLCHFYGLYGNFAAVDFYSSVEVEGCRPYSLSLWGLKTSFTTVSHHSIPCALQYLKLVSFCHFSEEPFFFFSYCSWITLCWSCAHFI